MLDTLVTRSVAAYVAAIAARDEKAILAAYRTLWPLFHTPKAQTALYAAYKRLKGVPPTDAPAMVAVASSTILPWAFFLTQGPTPPKQMPAHAIPRPVIDVAFVELAPPALRPKITQEVVALWERRHSAPVPDDVLKMFEAAGWEAVEGKAWSSGAGESHWLSVLKKATTGSTGSPGSGSATSSKAKPPAPAASAVTPGKRGVEPLPGRRLNSRGSAVRATLPEVPEGDLFL